MLVMNRIREHCIRRLLKYEQSFSQWIVLLSGTQQVNKDSKDLSDVVGISVASQEIGEVLFDDKNPANHVGWQRHCNARRGISE